MITNVKNITPIQSVIEQSVEDIIQLVSSGSSEAILRPALQGSFMGMVEIGRLSVLRDFDAICKADAFVGFNEDEWKAVRKFLEFNKLISQWDR